MTCPTAVTVAPFYEPDLPQPIRCLACGGEFDERDLRPGHEDECPNSDCRCELYGGSGREPTSDRRRADRFGEERR